MKKLFLLAALFLVTTPLLFATHQRAGEITYKCLSYKTYEVTIVTYTYTPSLADRPELELFWGDGTSDVVERIEKTNLPNDISRNVYTYNGTGTGGRHTYVASGIFTMWLEDPNRNAGIFNIPNSVNIPFYIETTVVVNPFFGINSSPVLLNPPIDNACLNQPFIHNPWAYDIDGDSLSYRLDSCKGMGGLYIPGYFYPPASTILTIDPITGDLLWDSPILNGEYNICIIIDEWRSGFWLGSVRRDMQITVLPCSNNPPVIANINDTCVLAGTFLSFLVSASDVDGDNLELTGNGGPLLLPDSPASFPQPVIGSGSVSSTFSWQTQCSHVQKLPYQMNFKVADDSNPVSLVAFSSVLITVVGPAPENLTATAFGNTINLQWNRSSCSNAIGYRIYRRSGYYGFFPDNCELGIPAYTGYVQIAEVPGLLDTTFTDNNNGQGLIRGNEYCYMVYAYYPDGAESYASLEACAELQRDVPVITHASVRVTDAANGSMYVAWSKPTEFDTVQIPGPYKYLIYRGQALNGSNLILIDSLAGINDTSYIDTLINTRDYPWHYRIDFYNDSPGNRFYVGSSEEASSTYLSLLPSDNTLTLNWVLDVPWDNEYYTVYRQNPSTLQYDSIGFSNTNSYDDTELTNGISYCYRVMGYGHYSAGGFADPLLNWSQEVCGQPTDNEPPCAPMIVATPDCELVRNTIVWTWDDPSCAEDAVRFNLYYGESESGDFQIIYTTINLNDTVYIHTGLFTIAACYYVTAVDSFGNESQPSALACVDIDECDLYELPNVFTPNDDGSNDLFIPFPYDFVEEVDMTIFNRWGKIVFQTTNPDIKWNGKSEKTDLECADGVYYFVCDVWEKRLNGIVQRTITGWVHLLR